MHSLSWAQGVSCCNFVCTLQKIFRIGLLVIPAVAVLNGCAGIVSANKSVNSSQQAAFKLSSTSITFGSVTVGKQATQSISVTNSGSMPLNITQATLSNAQFSLSGLTPPMALAVGQSSTFTVAVDASATGTVAGTLTVAGDSGSAPVVANLSATAVSAQPQLSLGASSINFGTVTVGSKGSSNLVLNNLGSVDLKISAITVSGASFSDSGMTMPATISAGKSSQLTVNFSPSAAGNDSGSISITSNDPTTPVLVVPLSGTASPVPVGQLSVSPASISFGSLTTGTSTSKQIVVSNTGNAAVKVSAITVSGTGYSVNGATVPLTINAASSVTLNVVFAPSSAGTDSGSLTITSNASNSSLTVSLSGTASVPVQPALTITPGSASFGSVTVGASSSQTIQFKNSGTGTLSITQASITGTGFSASSLVLPLSLGSGQSSSFNVQFAPASAGSVSGSLTVASNAPNSPVTVPLSGSGVAATLALSYSTSSLAFGNVTMGNSSALPVTITNTGNSNVQISQIGESGAGFTLTGASTPVTLAPTQTLTFDVNFSPSAAGTDSGSVTVTSNAAGSPKSIALSGNALQTSYTVSLNWAASTSSVSGYNVYRSTSSGSGFAKLNSNLIAIINYVDTTVQNGLTYYYVTTSVDSSGNESAYSNQATAVIP